MLQMKPQQVTRLLLQIVALFVLAVAPTVMELLPRHFHASGIWGSPANPFRLVAAEAQTLSASPSSVNPGGTVTASWSGLLGPTATDWIGLYAPGAGDGSFQSWMYVSCSQTPSSGSASGSCPYQLPGNASGNYELRLFANDGFNRLATSNTITISSLPVVSIAITDATASEANATDTGVLTVSRTGSTTAALTVNYAISGTATNGTDYQTLSGSVTIAAGQSSATITVTPINDSAAEGNESVTITLSSNAAYAIGIPAAGTVTIIDDETPPGPSISASPTSVAQGGTVTVTWSGIVNPSATDWFALYAPGTGNGSYLTWRYVNCGISATVAVPSGSCSVTTPSGLANGTYEFRLLANDGFTSIATSNLITVGPVLPTVTIAATQNAVEGGAEATFTVTRTGSTSSSLIINYTVSGSATNGTDYTNLPGSVTITANSSTATITVTPVDDSLVEDDETVILTLSSNAAYTVGSPSSATVTIQDNDAGDTTPPDTNITSGPSGTINLNTAAFTWTGSDNITPTGSLVYAYRLDPIEASFSAFSSSTSVSYSNLSNGNYAFYAKAKDQAGNEDHTPANRTFSVSLPTGQINLSYVGTPRDRVGQNNLSQGTDNHFDPTFTVTLPTGGSTRTVTSLRLDSADGGIWDTDSGTAFWTLGAASGLDAGLYNASNDVVNFTLAPGASFYIFASEWFLGQPFPNGIFTPGKQFALTIGFSDGTNTTAQTSIPAPGLPTVTVVATAPNAAEGGVWGAFTVTRTGELTSALTVNYGLSGTATNGSDYQSLPGSITIPLGASSTTITVNPIDDSLAEGSETVVLTLSSNAAYAIGTANSAILTITDNDNSLPTVAITALPTQPVSESAGTFGAFTVSRTGSTNTALIVNYVVGGTAIPNNDYVNLPGSVIISAGQATATMNLTVINDAVHESDETVTITLTPHPTYILGGASNVTLTITDNDPSDSVPPETTIVSGPNGKIFQTFVGFVWSGSDNLTPPANLVYASRLEPLEATFSTYEVGTSKTYANLSDGTYTFYVKARDQSGNEDPTPASRTFTIPGLQNGLAVAYGFEEGQGSTVTDGSGHARNGTLFGTSWSADGKYGNALSFNGSNAFVRSSDVSMSPSFTMTAWVFRSDATRIGDSIISITHPVLFAANSWLYIDAGEIWFQPENSLPSMRFGGFVSSNAWHHIAVTGDVNDTIRVYLDGVLLGGQQALYLLGATGDLYIGRTKNGSKPFLGKIDEVHIYNRTLAQSEIQEDMTRTFTLPTKLVVTEVNGGVSPTAGTPFSVTLKTQNANGVTLPVRTATAVTLAITSSYDQSVWK